MGFTEATDFLQSVGYERDLDERTIDYLERSAKDAMNAGLSAEIAARALSLLFDNVREAREVNLFGQALSLYTQDLKEDIMPATIPAEFPKTHHVAPPKPPEVAAPLKTTLLAPKATLADLERVLSRDETKDHLKIIGSDYMEDPLDWQELATCKETDPEAFFPEKGGSTAQAKKICVGCEVRLDCLDYALANNERFGIWGGLSERERRKLAKKTISVA